MDALAGTSKPAGLHDGHKAPQQFEIEHPPHPYSFFH
jgi:hypothetical protein